MEDEQINVVIEPELIATQITTNEENADG